MSAFWNDFSFPSPIDDLLPNPDCTLESLLDVDDVIRDTRSHKQILVDFLAKPEHVEKLFNYVTKEPEASASENVKFRYPMIACELLVAEVREIEKVIFDEPEKYLGALFDFWKPEKINIPLAAVVSHTMSCLLVSRNAEMLAYFKSRPEILDWLVNHVGVGTVKDHIGRMLNLDGEATIMAVGWLIENNIFGKYIAKLAPEYRAVHGDVADAIGELLELSHLDSPLFRSFYEHENLTALFEWMLKDNNRSALQHGLQIVNRVIEMIAAAEHSPQHETPAEDTMPGIVKVVLDYLPRLLPILKEDYPVNFKLGAGVDIKPFGAYRLKLIQLCDVLLMLEYDAVDCALMSHHFFPTLVDLFVTYEHNNILHRMVEGITLRILMGTNDDMLLSIFKEETQFHLRLVDAYTEKTSAEGKTRSPAVVPYILNLSEKVNEIALAKPPVAEILSSCASWMEYEKNVLQPHREESAKVLGGVPPERMSGLNHDGSFSEALAHDIDDDDDDDDDSNSDDPEDEDEDEEDDLDLPDDTDMSSESDYRDYDSSQSEVLLSKLEIEELLEG